MKFRRSRRFSVSHTPGVTRDENDVRCADGVRGVAGQSGRVGAGRGRGRLVRRSRRSWAIPASGSFRAPRLLGPNSGPPAFTARSWTTTRDLRTCRSSPLTFSAGLGRRAEVFGSLRTVTRIDRDIRPLFVPSNLENGGVLNGYPFVQEPWTGNDMGDLIVGGKYNLASQIARRPGGLRGSGMLKLPTADAGHGRRHRRSGLHAGWNLQRRGRRRRALRLRRLGVARRVPPSQSLRQFPMGSRGGLRRAQRVSGSRPSFSGTSPSTTSSGATPCRLPPSTGRGLRSSRSAESDLTAAFGATWQHRSGFFAGAGLSYRFGLESRSDVMPGFSDNSARRPRRPVPDRFLARPEARAPASGGRTHSGSGSPAPHRSRRRPPPAPAPRSESSADASTAQCDPCRIPVGGTIKIIAQGQDPDGDQLTYVWTAALGRSATPVRPPPPGEPRPYRERSRSLSWPPTGAAVRRLKRSRSRSSHPRSRRSEILFDFDQATIRPEAIPILDQAVQALNAGSGPHHSSGGPRQLRRHHRIQPGAQRAPGRSRPQLPDHAGHRAGANHFQGFGETRPVNENRTEAERRLNRRAALIVLLQ